MARIAGVDVPNNKKVEIGLTYIFGIGRSTAKKIVEETGIDSNKRIGELSEQEISSIRKYIDSNLKVEGELRKEIGLNIKRLMEINCYRGYRHKNNMPCRGQKTRSNARTRRGLAGKRGIKRK
ncbi:30S ribosomal protein S13 [Deferribacter desulfuricans SSM1]|uniref:Small ribosomal subunit protein uS13 n=1 Tax=Deferribacter desulfuricans (strain DSM 14783 / JCM 11476 / NBRC 101012 / SSM1) TaxID=639282 RepID=D3P913_DEFDS|nr:30S ribosomal protein S13 [Deferribacter desulfuricans]BAI81203.1 30S ribosomal protein S13 [Deferribacter desulfuricans SSM1]